MPAKSQNRIKFENHPNPFNLKWAQVKYRIKSGKTFEEAINSPIKQSNKSDFKKEFNEHSNPYDLKWKLVKQRLDRGWNFEQAINEPLNKKYSNAKIDRKTKRDIYLELDNPYNLTLEQVIRRTENLKISVEKAMSYPINPNKIAFENHPNPYNLKEETVYYRMKRKGETLEKAMSYPARKIAKIDEDRIKFENHKNPFNLRLDTVKARIKKGEGFETAMNYPAGGSKVNIYRNSFVMFKGKWTSTNDLIQLFDSETTENMIRAGVEAEKLFKRKG